MVARSRAWVTKNIAEKLQTAHPGEIQLLEYDGRNNCYIEFPYGMDLHANPPEVEVNDKIYPSQAMQDELQKLIAEGKGPRIEMAHPGHEPLRSDGLESSKAAQDYLEGKTPILTIEPGPPIKFASQGTAHAWELRDSLGTVIGAGPKVNSEEFMSAHTGNKYVRYIRDRFTGKVIGRVDVYNVFDAFGVDNLPHPVGHAAKKLLCAGQRGHKDTIKDLTEAIDALKRAVEILKSKEPDNGNENVAAPGH
jgi:hypothetical protein